MAGEAKLRLADGGGRAGDSILDKQVSLAELVDVESFREPSGPEVVPGDYTVKVLFGEHEATAPVRVVADPRSSIPAEARAARHAAEMRAGQLQESLTAAILRLGRTRQDVETVLARLAAADDEKGDAAGGAGAAGAEGAEGIGAAVGPDLAGEGRRLLSGLDELEKTLWWPPETKGIPPETDAWSPVQRAGWFLGSSWEAPTAAERRYLEIAEEATAAALEGYGRFEAERLAPFRARVREARVELLPEEELLAAP